MKVLRDFILPIVVGLTAFVFFHATLGSFKVYGSSMWPTIEHGEYILVNKATYFFHEPQRGDIIVFHSPNDPSSDLIKRIIGIPGDIVEVRDEKVFVNNVAVAEPYIIDPPRYLYPEEEIPAGQYFVLGDNRNSSSDSHKGWKVPRHNIVGKAWLTYWPPHRWRLIPHYAISAGAKAAVTDKSSLNMEVLCPMR